MIGGPPAAELEPEIGAEPADGLGLVSPGVGLVSSAWSEDVAEGVAAALGVILGWLDGDVTGGVVPWDCVGVGLECVGVGDVWVDPVTVNEPVMALWWIEHSKLYVPASVKTQEPRVLAGHWAGQAGPVVPSSFRPWPGPAQATVSPAFTVALDGVQQ